MPSLKDMQAQDMAAAEETVGPGPSNEAPTAPAAPGAENAAPIAAESAEKPAGGRIDPDDPESSNVSNEEQAEYARAINALYEVLYQNEKTGQAVADQLELDEKVGSVARTTLLLVKSIDEKLDIDEEVLAQFILDTTNEVLEIAESKGIKLSQTEQEQALAAVWEGALIVFGGTDEIQPDYDAFTQGMSEEQIQEAKGMAQSLLDEGEGVEQFDTEAAAPAAPAAPAGPPAAPTGPPAAPTPGVV